MCFRFHDYGKKTSWGAWKDKRYDVQRQIRDACNSKFISVKTNCKGAMKGEKI